ncbi:MAG: class I SAM-dependent RNA methyltransferase [Saprospiraceae bacterium]
MQEIIAKTFAGLEAVLADELQALGATNIRVIKRAVVFAGDTQLLYRANYELRTALRILVPIHSFSANCERDLYKGVRNIDWSNYMQVSDTLAVDAVAQGEIFRHSQYVALLTKDAIVDQFRDRYQRRPNVNTLTPGLRVNVHVLGNHCDITLDATAGSLHRRNYRRDTVEAPLNEVLAAGMVLLSGWNALGPFVDPMCGSGTLAIEAALLALRIPPQFMRANFGFFKWPDFDRKVWESVKKAADAGAQKSFEFPIIASDKDTRARNAAAVNVLSAGLENVIQVEKMPFEKVQPPVPPGTLVTNPPYDERLKLEDTAEFYRGIGDTLKKNWPDWNAWLISSNRDALKSVGLRPSKRVTLFNGALECSFQKFELYTGSRRKEERTAEELL